MAQADLFADAGGGQSVVPGDHNHADAGGVAGTDGLRDFRAYRIGQSRKAQKNELVFDLLGAVGSCLATLRLLGRQRQGREARGSPWSRFPAGSGCGPVRSAAVPRFPLRFDRIVQVFPAAPLLHTRSVHRARSTLYDHAHPFTNRFKRIEMEPQMSPADTGFLGQANERTLGGVADHAVVAAALF